MKYYAEKERFKYNTEERNGKKYRIYSAEQIGEETNFSSSPPHYAKNVWMIKSKQARMQ